MNPRMKLIDEVVGFLELRTKTPGYYGPSFIEDLDHVIEALQRLRKTFTGVDPQQFETVFKMGYEAATSSIPFEEALAAELSKSKQV